MNYYNLPSNKIFLISLKALIVEEDKILILKNKGDDKGRWTSQWELPGGILEIDEELQDALVREVAEETALEIQVSNPFATWINIVKDFKFLDGRTFDSTIFCVVYLCKKLKGEVKISDEHKEFKWVRKDELKNCDFSPNSKPAIESFLTTFNKP